MITITRPALKYNKAVIFSCSAQMPQDPYFRYVRDPCYADDVRWILQKADVKHVPTHVLSVHWHSSHTYNLLDELSTQYAIVPNALDKFVADCVKRNRCFYNFLHPTSLFDYPELADWVYCHIGSTQPDADVLDVLLRLSRNAHSKNYCHRVEQYLLDAFRSSEAHFCGSRVMCALVAHYLAGTEKLCVHTLKNMLMDRGMHARVQTLALLSHLPLTVHAQLITEIVWCAVYGYGQAARYVQDLSFGPYTTELAKAIQEHPHQFYVDRLHIQVLQQIIPYLIHYRAISSLVRVYEANVSSAVQQGVLSSLLANGIKPPPMACLTVQEPHTVHELIQFMYVHQTAPNHQQLIERAMTTQLQALRTIEPTTHGLLRRMIIASNYYRRRVFLIMLLQGISSVMQNLRCHEFAWPLVFAYL